MKEVVKQLSKPFKFIRVDLYCVKDKIYFRELTFVPEVGRSLIKPIEYDYKLGSLWK